MMKRALVALAGLVCLAQAVSAQSIFGRGLLDQPSINSPWALLDSHDRFTFATAFGSMRQSPEYLPAFNPSEPSSTTYMMPSDNKSSVDRVLELRRSHDIRFGGEIGFLYGKSTGNGFGREDFSSYIVGTVGNDTFSITAGYYRQETTFTGPRIRR